METIKRLVVAIYLGRGDGQSTQRTFRAVKLFHMVLQWWIHVIIHLSKPIECTTVNKP